MKTPDPVRPQPEDLAGRSVVVAVCGGIAAYKVCTVVSTLVQRGARVTVAMTDSATRFVGPVTFRALTARPVLTDLFDAALADDPQHIHLMQRADAMLIAPATANVIAKAAHGICDDLVTTLLAAADCPILCAPSMNDVMWANPIVQSNVRRLEETGFEMIGPAEGWMACRSTGMGRLADPEDIIRAVGDKLMAVEPRPNQTPPETRTD